MILCFVLPRCAAGALNARINGRETSELMQNHVSNLQQDAAGYLWFATWNGLMRYDGHRLHIFKPIQCSDGTIDSNRIYNIKFSSDGNIWCVSSDNRLFLFNPKECKFTNISAQLETPDDLKVKTLTPLRDGHTWVTFRNGSTLRLTDSLPENHEAFFDNPSRHVDGASKIVGITLSENGDEWVLTDRGALNFSTNEIVKGNFKFAESLLGNTYLIAPDGLVVRTSDGRRYSALRDNEVKVNYLRTEKNRIIAATDRGVYTLDTDTGGCEHASDIPSIYLFKDSRHRIWALGESGKVSLIEDITKPTCRELQAPPATNGAEKIKNPQLIFETADGSIVMKPSGAMLCSYDEGSESLEAVKIDESGAGYSPSNIKKYLVDRSGNLWVLHDDGIDCVSLRNEVFHFDRKGSEVRALFREKDGREWIAQRSGLLSTDGFSMKTAPVYAISQSPEGDIWLGTKGEGVYILTPDAGGRYKVKHLRRPEIHSDTIYDIAFAGGRVWLGSYGEGLAEGTPTADGLKFRRTPGQPQGMKIRKIQPDSNGNLLIATTDGLVTTDAPSSRSPRFFIDKYRADEQGLKGNDIMGIVENGGEYYLGVFGSGVSRLDSDSLPAGNLQFTTATLPAVGDADQIRTLISVDDDIFIFSGGTITRFTPRNGRIVLFSADDFGETVQFSEALPIVADGLIVAGTMDGTLSFDPKRLLHDDTKHSVEVTGILFRNDTEIRPLYRPEAITVNPDRRSFTLFLSDMDRTSGHSTVMRYRLDGFDEEWNYISSENSIVTLSNLPPGRYGLIVETESPDGEWEEAGQRVILDVTPKFTETVWFRIGIVLAILGLMVALAFAALYFRKLRNNLQRKYSLLMTIGRISDDMAKSATGSQTDPEAEAKEFIEKSMQFLEQNIDNPDLMIENFARHLGMSRTSYYNRMKEVAGVSPVEFVRQMRIKRALKYLENGGLTISEVAYRTGFSDPKYFSRCFKAEMGMTPSQYAASVSESSPSQPCSPDA